MRKIRVIGIVLLAGKSSFPLNRCLPSDASKMKHLFFTLFKQWHGSSEYHRPLTVRKDLNLRADATILNQLIVNRINQLCQSSRRSFNHTKLVSNNLH